MGARGPAKKPAELEKLQGNPSRRKIIDDVKFETPKETPSAPLFLDRIAKKEWERIAPLLHKSKLLTEADIATLAAYCSAYSMWVKAEKEIRVKGELTYETDKGNQMQIPEIGIANQSKKQMLIFAKEFGLTPSARAGLHIDNPEEQESSIMQFIKRIK